MSSSTPASATAEPGFAVDAPASARHPGLRRFLESWRRFRRHRIAMGGLGLLVLLGLLAAAAPLLTPYDASRQSL